MPNGRAELLEPATFAGTLLKGLPQDGCSERWPTRSLKAGPHAPRDGDRTSISESWAPAILGADVSEFKFADFELSVEVVFENEFGSKGLL
jgi:hypothetical protein